MTSKKRLAAFGPCLIVLLALALSSAALAAARQPAVDPQRLVAVELATVAISRQGDIPVALLREPESADIVPIFIGHDVARAILMALHEVPVPRPMTHDLMSDLITALGARVERVFVDDLVEGTYLGMLELSLPEQEQRVYIDARPSDALALATRTGAAILVAPNVLEANRHLEFDALEDDQVVSAIGITVVEATAELRTALELPETDGVLVSRAVGEAASAGIAAGSLIIQVNAETPASPMEFLQLLRKSRGEENVMISYWRDGEEHQVELPTEAPPPRREREPESLSL